MDEQAKARLLAELLAEIKAYERRAAMSRSLGDRVAAFAYDGHVRGIQFAISRIEAMV